MAYGSAAFSLVSSIRFGRFCRTPDYGKNILVEVASLKNQPAEGVCTLEAESDPAVRLGSKSPYQSVLSISSFILRPSAQSLNQTCGKEPDCYPRFRGTRKK